jgi:hypothetical protein
MQGGDTSRKGLLRTLTNKTCHFGTLIAPDWMPSAIRSRILA